MILASLVAVVAAVASCDRCGATGSAKDAEPAGADASADAGVNASANASAGADASAKPDSSAAGETAAVDAGPSSCRLVYGPAEQPFRGPAAMVIAPGELRLVANDAGKPRIFTVPVAPPPPAGAPAIETPRPASFAAMRWPPCEIAGRWAYCQAAGANVYRTTLGQADTKQIAKSAPATRIAAAPLGTDHAVLATLDVRRTTEGAMLQAFATLDDGETVRLSEDGAGATTIRLVPRGEKIVALYLDTRTAMVPVHARTIGLKGKNELALLDDAVVFVGGPPERGIDFGVAGGARYLFVLLPIAKEVTDFGMAAIPIADPPKDDTPAVWSSYPNGLDPAPLAGSVEPGTPGPAWVARVRPRERAVGSPRILELGRIDATGSFSSLGAVAAAGGGKQITDVAVAADTYGAVWILYGDSGATWLERRLCPRAW